MIILFGTPKWIEWHVHLLKLPHTVHFHKLNDINLILAYIQEHNIELIIPLTIEQKFLIIDHMEQLSHVKIICDKNKQNTTLLDNKYEFCKYMIANNFNEFIPEVYITNYNQTQIIHNKLTYPCIFKFHQESGSIGTAVLTNEDELNNAFFLMKRKNYIIQKYISGENEYAGHLYILNGDIKHFIVYMATNNRKNYIQYGSMKTCVRMPDFNLTNSACMNTFSELFKKLNYTGFACIDFKIIDNKLQIFEINPRLGGSLVCNITDLTDMIASSIVT